MLQIAEQTTTPIVKATTPADTTAKPVAPRRTVVVAPAKHLSASDSVFFGLVNNEDSLYFDANRLVRDVQMRNIRNVEPTAIDSAYLCSMDTALHTTQQVDELQYHERALPPLNSDVQWIMTIVVGVVVLLGVVKAISNDYISRVMSLIYSDFNWSGIIASIEVRNYWSSRILLVTSQIVFSLLLYEMIISYSNTEQYVTERGPILFLLIWGGVFAYHIFKVSMHKLIGYTFDIKERTSYIVSRRFLEHSIRGILILPVVILFPFVPYATYPILSKVAVIIMIIMYLWRVLRSIRINLNHIFSLFYVVLYLCAVELIPLICLFKTAVLVVSQQQ